MKKILLDTHVFLWWIDDRLHHNIPDQAKSQIADPGNQVYVSAASVWEIAIKKSIGALQAPENMESIIEAKGFSNLEVNAFHAEQAGSLPLHAHPETQKPHKDPFDRMLIAQAQAEGMYLMSKDAAFSAYAVRLIRL